MGKPIEEGRRGWGGYYVVEMYRTKKMEDEGPTARAFDTSDSAWAYAKAIRPVMHSVSVVERVLGSRNTWKPHPSPDETGSAVDPASDQ